MGRDLFLLMTREIYNEKKSGSPERLFPYLQLLTYEKKLLLL